MANGLDDNLDRKNSVCNPVDFNPKHGSLHGNLDGCLELLVDLIPELPLDCPYNVYAAGQRGLTFNPEKGAYVDSNGSVIEDPNNYPFSK